jgi:hypothetical protein
MKHLKLYEDYLIEQTLNEIGEGVTPFSWKRIGNNKVGTWMADMSKQDKADLNNEVLPWIEYEFKSDNATYIVKFGGHYARHISISFFQKPNAPKPHEYDVFIGVAFDTRGSEKEVITNFGEQFKVISTVSAILQEVMKELQEIQWIKVQEIHIAPKLEDDEDGKPIAQSKRGRLYLEYIKKQGSKLKGDWSAETRKDRFVLRNGKWSSPTNPDMFFQL